MRTVNEQVTDSREGGSVMFYESGDPWMSAGKQVQKRIGRPEFGNVHFDRNVLLLYFLCS